MATIVRVCGAPSAYSQIAGRSSSLQVAVPHIPPRPPAGEGLQGCRLPRGLIHPVGPDCRPADSIKRRVAADVGNLGRLVEIDRDHVHAIGNARRFRAPSSRIWRTLSGKALGPNTPLTMTLVLMRLAALILSRPLDAAYRAVTGQEWALVSKEARPAERCPSARSAGPCPGDQALVGEVEDDADAGRHSETGNSGAGAAGWRWGSLASIPGVSIVASLS